MKIKYGTAIASVFFSILLMSGCGPKQPWETAGVSEDFYEVTEDFAQRYLELDQDGYQYDQALEAVDAYLTGENSQDEALSLLKETIHYFETELAGWETVSLDETLVKHLQAIDISPAEYEAFVNSRPNDLQTQQMDLFSLMYDLQYVGEDKVSQENLSWSLSKNQTIQDSMRGYYYYGCLNYWFPGADDAERAYLEDKVISQLHAYIPEDPGWYTTREDTEAQVMLYLDEVEEVLNQFADYVGQQQNDLYEMEQELETALESLKSSSEMQPAE